MRWRAATNPSPPLLPGPQSTATGRLPQCRRAVSATARPAASISAISLTPPATAARSATAISAGGGSFLSFPALLFIGVPPVAANVTNNLAGIPGIFSSVWAYRHDIRTATRFDIRMLVAVSLLGGLVGALLLLSTPSAVFRGFIPWLMLLATLVFAFGNFAPPRLLQRVELGSRGVNIAQFFIAVYGGYFGAGIGFLMLAALTLYGMREIHAMNGLKLIFALAMSVVSSGAFILAGKVLWPEAVIMGLASLAGGYAGARGAKFVAPRLLKTFVVVLGAALTVYFFAHGA